MKGLVSVWRDTVRDSDLRAIGKLTGHTLATFMNARGLAWPSRETLARGSSVSLRSVDAAISELEAGGFVDIERTRGRSSHRYQATLSPTAQEMRRSEWATAQMATPNRANDDTNRAGAAGESVESAESRALRASAAVNGASARACDECRVGGGLHAEDCSLAVEA